jgi:GNAT superfamily N-acetyltransferase
VRADVRLRDATPDDQLPVVELLRAANAQFREAMPGTLFDGYLANVADIDRRVREGSTLVVAVEGERLLGSITFYPDVSQEGFGLPPDWAGFRALGVHPDARGRGVGRLLVEHCVERAERLGARTVGIHTGAFMTAAVRIYEQVGFVRCPEYDTDATHLFGGDRPGAVTAIAFRLELPT